VSLEISIKQHILLLPRPHLCRSSQRDEEAETEIKGEKGKQGKNRDEHEGEREKAKKTRIRRRRGARRWKRGPTEW